MTTQEFSDQFDVLYNNITSNQAPGLNEYEKSVFLTKAQEEKVKNYFTPKGNPHQDGFDGSPKRQADFSTLIRVGVATAQNYNAGTSFDERVKGVYYYNWPTDVFIMLNEQIYSSNTPYVVVPISYEEYDKLMAKPYKYPPKYQAWRLITSYQSATQGYTQVQVIGIFKGVTEGSAPTYKVRYVKRPKAIILTNLSDIQNGLTINGDSTEQTSELPEEMHEEILQRAVELAKIAWAGDPAATIQTGQRSE